MYTEILEHSYGFLSTKKQHTVQPNLFEYTLQGGETPCGQ